MTARHSAPCCAGLRVAGLLLASLASAWPTAGQGTGASSTAPAVAAPVAAVRRLTLDDFFSLENLSDVALSPDGQWVAATIIRPLSVPENRHEQYGRGALVGWDRADIWLVPTQGGAPKNLTMGAGDGSGYFRPVWSPDSKRIAMYSTKGGDDIRPYLWDAATGSVTRLTDRGIDFVASDPEVGSEFATLLRWIDDSTILCPLVPRGEVSLGILDEGRSMPLAVHAWQKVVRGAEPTSSALESGAGAPPTKLRELDLAAINVTRRTVTVLTPTALQGFMIAPDGRHAAIFDDLGAIPPTPGQSINFGASRHQRIGLLDLTGHDRVRWVEGVEPNTNFAETVGGRPDRWSPDGSTLTVVGKARPGDTAANVVWAIDTHSAVARRLTADTLRVAGVAWTPDGRLLAYVLPRAGDTTATHQAAPAGAAAHADHHAPRPDWWLLRPGDVSRNITARMHTAPATLRSGPTGNTLLGIADSTLWSVNVDRGMATALTTRSDGTINDILWPTTAAALPARGADVLINADHSPLTTGRLYRVALDAGGGHVTPMSLPTPRAALRAYDRDRGVALFSSEEASGMILWAKQTKDSVAHATPLMTLNAQLASVTLGRKMAITYRGIDGDTLRARVTLPVDYQPGTRYPVVTWVYAGSIRADSLVPPATFETGSPFEFQLLAARGYVVLEPSMPLGPDGMAGDPYMDLTKGVLPALDKLIDLGIADPNRLGVMGQSYGGYSTYSLVTYTHRFKAAVALAGPADLVSDYGTFFAPTRYTDTPHEDTWTPAWAETGQGRMGAAPYGTGNFWRYLRNSPAFYVDRIETPLLIMQGDQDIVSITQGEEMFTGLYRLGKRARFVRYWGEGHVFESPANIRDMWTEILAWFDRYLVAPSTGSPKGASARPAAGTP